MPVMEDTRRRHLVGIAGISAAVLMLEIALTRVFSATMWYHFAFLSISLALLGGAVAGVCIYLLGERLPASNLLPQLASCAFLFSVAIAVCFVLFLHIPFHVNMLKPPLQAEGVLRLALIYFVLAVPFFFGGAGITLALSRWSRSVGHVYFSDLLGAGVGCLLSILALNELGGPGAILAAALIAALAAVLFAAGRVRAFASLWALTLVALMIVRNQVGFLDVVSTKATGIEQQPIFESWNSFSRVTVHRHWTPYAFGWGMSEIHQEPDPGHHMLLIDSAAGTPIQRFDGDLGTVEFLKDDVASFAYYLLDQPSVLVIGPGGGRDILTALVFGMQQVVGVELNPAIIRAVRDDFAEYAGHVYDQAGVQVVIDDARRFIAGSQDRYDLIQASVIDTWAATTAGAFALSENSLYTQEAFQTYFEHLSPTGILSISRWYLQDQPAETLRLVLLGIKAWELERLVQPSDHVMVVLNPRRWPAPESVATLLLSRRPFTPEQVTRAQREADRLGFEILYAPGLAVAENPVAKAVLAPDREVFVASYPLDISPPTDDRPFFFSLARLGPLLNRDWYTSTVYRKSVEALNVLTALLGITVGVSALFLTGPLLVARRRQEKEPLLPRWLTYFASLGLAFMLIEIPVVQRMSLFLGHPTYALAVVLFSILVFSGLGSLATNRIFPSEAMAMLRRVIPILLLLILLFAFAGSELLNLAQTWSLGLRILATVVMSAPLGFLMGMPFPLGWKWASQDGAGATPWLWSINGAMSVVGSVLAALVAIQYGFRSTMLLGMMAYGTAWIVCAFGPPRLTRNFRPGRVPA